MKNMICVFILAALSVIKAQWDVSAGMGINQVYSSSFKEYVNIMRNGELDDFYTAADFIGTINYSFNDKYQLGLEIDYSLYSYNSEVVIGNYEISYGIIKPSLVFNYLLKGEGYMLKFGGGAGIRLIEVNEKISPLDITYSAKGFGVLLKAEGHTKLSEDFYALIGVDTRLDFSGDLKDGDKPLYNSVDKENVSLGAFSVGLKLGVSYVF